jgi:formylglycine-generating enzyme required for sulfatase activity
MTISTASPEFYGELEFLCHAGRLLGPELYARLSWFSMASPLSQAGSGGFRQPEMSVIPAGTFLMGSECGQDNERPVHRVQIDTFRLGTLQVTNEDYRCFVLETARLPPPFWGEEQLSDPRQPVVGVSWFEAVHYCEWLSERAGEMYRLPTEAEWEYAARGGTEGAAFPWGDAAPDALPRYADRWRNGPEPVGESAPNAFGLFEMCENVHEWCSDWFDPEYYAVSPERNPQGPESGQRRASRGGSWRHHIKVSRCAARSSIPPGFHYADYGFRVACSL